MILSTFRKPFVVLLTVPASIALGIGLLPLVTVFLERQFARDAFSPFVLQFSVESAHTLLSVVATGAMTALSLAYSLVLVVFTLAAGNIGPRLLQRFTSELVNQITAGILGGTFLYAILTLLMTQPNFVPKITILGAVLLAIISVLQLIYFVRHVSQSVSVDDEIAQITKRITKQLNDLQRTSNPDGKTPARSKFKHDICAQKAGYVGWFDEDYLTEIAKKHDLMIWVEVSSGGFVLAGQNVAQVAGDADEDVLESIRKHITIENARSEDRSPEFSINLLVEIALRALSPGINDTYTALAVANSFSNAFAEIAEADTAPILTIDDDGDLRLILPAMSMEELLGQAFHPIRLATAGNILMAQGFARALARLYVVGGKEMRKLVKEHAGLLMQSLEASDHFDHDLQRVRACFPEALKSSGKNTAKS